MNSEDNAQFVLHESEELFLEESIPTTTRQERSDSDPEVPPATKEPNQQFFFNYQ